MYGTFNARTLATSSRRIMMRTLRDLSDPRSPTAPSAELLSVNRKKKQDSIQIAARPGFTTESGPRPDDERPADAMSGMQQQRGGGRHDRVHRTGRVDAIPEQILVGTSTLERSDVWCY